MAAGNGIANPTTLHASWQLVISRPVLRQHTPRYVSLIPFVVSASLLLRLRARVSAPASVSSFYRSLPLELYIVPFLSHLPTSSARVLHLVSPCCLYLFALPSRVLLLLTVPQRFHRDVSFSNFRSSLYALHVLRSFSLPPLRFIFRHPLHFLRPFRWSLASPFLPFLRYSSVTSHFPLTFPLARNPNRLPSLSRALSLLPRFRAGSVVPRSPSLYYSTRLEKSD